jgi:hypothetical protein
MDALTLLGVAAWIVILAYLKWPRCGKTRTKQAPNRRVRKRAFMRTYREMFGREPE